MNTLSRITTLSNILSLVRGPLAFFFLFDSHLIRICAVLLAMISDSLDGYIARRYGSVSHFGTILDPLMDRFFVFFSVTVLVLENKIAPWQMTALLSRDIVMISFTLLVTFFGRLENCKPQATFWGKATTAGQFFLLIAILSGLTIPFYLFFVFIGLALLLLKEVFGIYQHNHTLSKS